MIPRRVALLALFVLAPVAAQEVSRAPDPGAPDPDAPGLGGGARVEALQERIRLEQSSLETLEARFTQRKESDLLLEPETSTGRFWFEAPDRIRWEFDEPDTIIVVKDDVMLSWYRDLGRAESVRMGSQGEKILQFLGAGPSLQKLQGYFDLEYGFPDDPEAPFRIRLEPRFERVSRRLQEIELRLDRDLYVPVYLRYVEPGGAVTEMHFQPQRKNEALPEGLFDLALPDDVAVQEIDLSSDG